MSDVAQRLEDLATEIRGEWPKFTEDEGVVYEYSSASRYRSCAPSDGWSEFGEFIDDVYCDDSCETPITPAAAARLTGGGVEVSYDTELRDDFAIAAMKAIGSCDIRSEAHHDYDLWATSCYKFADAMLVARNRQQ